MSQSCQVLQPKMKTHKLKKFKLNKLKKYPLFQNYKITQTLIMMKL